MTRSILHFERLISELLMKWYETEKKLHQLHKEEKKEFIHLIKDSIESIQSTLKENSVKVNEYYCNIELSVINDIFDPIPLSYGTFTADQHELNLNGSDTPIKQLLKNSFSNDDSPTIKNRMSRKLSREPIIRIPSNLKINTNDEFTSRTGGGESIRNSPSVELETIQSNPPVVKLKDKLILYITTIGKLFKNEKYRLINIIKQNRQKRYCFILLYCHFIIFLFY